MPQVRLLAPWTDSKGNPQAAGAVIDVSDEEATALGNRGMVSRLDEEKALEDQDKHYTDVAQRSSSPGGTPSTETPAPPPAPKGTAKNN